MLSLEDIESHILSALQRNTDAVVAADLQAARIGLQAIMARRMEAATVRVCAISDAECSRGCGTGACNPILAASPVEKPAPAPIPEPVAAQPSIKLAHYNAFDDAERAVQKDVQALRAILGSGAAAQPSAEVTDAMIDAAIEALGPCVGSCGEASPPDRCDIKYAIEAALAARSGDKQ